MVKTPPSNAGGPGSLPGWGTKFPKRPQAAAKMAQRDTKYEPNCKLGQASLRPSFGDRIDVLLCLEYSTNKYLLKE